MTAGIEKIFSAMPNIGFLAHAATLATEAATPGITGARIAEISRLIWNDRIDAAMTAFFIAVVAIVLVDSARVWTKLTLGSGGSARNAHRVAA
jgi:carbon starvation protein